MSDAERNIFHKQNIIDGEAVSEISPQGGLSASLSFSPSNVRFVMYIPEGYIIVARKSQKSEIWNKPAWWWKVFCYLLMEVNHKDLETPRGTKFFQYKTIFHDCCLHKERGIKPNSIDNLVRWMRVSGICTTQKTTRGIRITLCNYDIYQNPDNYKNDTENETKTRQKRHRNDTINNNGRMEECKKKDSNALRLTDEEFLSSLSNNPAYGGIDIPCELAKMDAWLAARPGRQKTRRFIVNWLNKIDKPIKDKPKEEKWL